MELNALCEGEVREHQASVREFRQDSRFLKVTKLGEAFTRPVWKNAPPLGAIPVRTPRPLIPHTPELPTVSLASLDRPVFSVAGPEREFGHLHRFAWTVLVAKPLLACILELDHAGVEFVPVTLVDPDTGRKRDDLPECFLVMPLRAIDCLDTARTSYRLSFVEPLPAITKPMRQCSFEEYVIRADLPEEIHIFSNVFSGDLIFSTRLIKLAEQAGVWGIWAHRTEKGHTELSWRLYGDREELA